MAILKSSFRRYPCNETHGYRKVKRRPSHSRSKCSSKHLYKVRTLGRYKRSHLSSSGSGRHSTFSRRTISRARKTKRSTKLGCSKRHHRVQNKGLSNRAQKKKIQKRRRSRNHSDSLKAEAGVSQRIESNAESNTESQSDSSKSTRVDDIVPIDDSQAKTQNKDNAPTSQSDSSQQ